MRVAGDTNVLVSALIADGPPARLIEEAVYGRVELVLLDLALAELEQVLTKKLGFGEERWRTLEEFLTEVAYERAPPAEKVESVTGHPADDEILASTVSSNAEVLATGDRKHLLPLGDHRGVRILTPQALLAELK